MPLTTHEQKELNLTEEVERLNRENQLLKERYRLNERKFDVIIGSVREGAISFYFNDASSWESQVPKEDFRGRYIEKENEKHYIYPMANDFKVYVFSEKQARAIRESYRLNGKGIGGYRKSITNEIVCKSYLYQMTHDLAMKYIYDPDDNVEHLEVVEDADELRLFDLFTKDMGDQGYEHEQMDRGHSLDLIRAIQKILSKTKI